MTEGKAVWAAVIAAAGSGTRFGGSLPKQFTGLNGRMVIDHSIRAFRGLVSHIVAVVPPNGGWNPPEDVYTVPGGERRQDSVMAGLEKAMELGATHVLVHDGARPLIHRSTVLRVMESTEKTGTGLPCIPVRDTVKRVGNGIVTATVDRTDLVLAQTPQGFSASLLLDALKKAGSVTDEASAVEAAGKAVSIVEGCRMNLKLTDEEDRYILERLMKRETKSLGTGLDFHPFAPERPLMFCGCRLSESNGLCGHSDGDVVLHAVADAILAASRTGDIGTLFPPDDDKWKNADSSVLLAECMEMVRRSGWEVKLLDVTVIGERPKVAGIRDVLIERLSKILKTPGERLWIKGTTTNTLGELAKGKGVGCHVLAELVRAE